jgi:hypothetical protein
MSKRGFKTTPPPTTPVKATSNIPATPSWRLIPLSTYLAVRSSVPTFFIVVLPPLLIQLGLVLGKDFKYIDRWTVLGVWIILLGFVLTMLNSVVSYNLQLQVVSGRHSSIIGYYRQSIRYALRLIGFSVLFGCIVLVGLLCFIVPGIKAISRYVLTPYFILEYDEGIRASMQRSAAASKPYTRAIWGTLIMVGLCGSAAFGLQKIAGVYGTCLGIVLSVCYVYLPALRFRECALQLSAASIKD